MNTNEFVLDADTFKKIQPLEYLRRFISQNVRPDGRSLVEPRNILFHHVPLQNCSGSATVKIGNSLVTCGIKTEIAQPNATTPTDGFFVPNVDLPALSAAKFRPGPPAEQTQTLSDQINQLFLSVPILNLSDLCIESGKAVWVLYADIVCLNYDGSILDAAMAALMASLRNLRLPKVEIVDNLPVVDTNKLKPIELTRLVFNTTFCLFDSQVLIDPTDDEESMATSLITIMMDNNGMFCGIGKLGGECMEEKLLKSCIGLAKSRTKKSVELLEKSFIN
ncbi:ribosomal protein S5 domain 2-type protein [Globomyces pollinis-pini]|nr:ribosomal protein S5 domain 2-type protein [Globomyces pollinis-pini]